MKLGDAVAALTKSLGIEQCDQCKQRQAVLNELGEKLKKLLGGTDETSNDVGSVGSSRGRAEHSPDEPR